MAISTVYLLIVTVCAQGILGQLDLPPKDPVDEVTERGGAFALPLMFQSAKKWSPWERRRVARQLTSLQSF